jgi:hypothetical protein
MNIDVNGQSFNYDQLIHIARNIDPENYMDIVHDHILTGKPLKGLRFNYFTVNSYDRLKNESTCNTCIKCNTIKPIAEFQILTWRGKDYVTNICAPCKASAKKERYHNDEEYRKKYLAWNKKYYEKNKDKLREYYREMQRKKKTERINNI